LKPIGVDGRQLSSDKCRQSKGSTFMRYNQSETFERYETLIDPYHHIPRLNMYRFDGSPLPPMYLAFRPPTMLPTTTLNPTATATATHKPSKFKRSLLHSLASGRESDFAPLAEVSAWLNPNHWFWCGVAFTGFGSVLLFAF